MLAKLGGGGNRVEGAFQNACIGAWFPAWLTSLVGDLYLVHPLADPLSPIIS